MRRTLAVGLILVCGCSLNFGTPGDDELVFPDARQFPPPPPPDPCDSAIAQCDDGVVTLSEWPGETCDQFDPPPIVGTCAGACTTDDTTACFSAGCAFDAYALCVDPPAAPLPPTLGCATTNPTCTADGTTACGGSDACGGAVLTGSCTCAGDVRTCDPACADGLCSATAVQTALAGTWSGTVTTPTATYTGSITFTADGHYATELPGQQALFYYGADGAGDARRFHVLGQTELGATALVRIYFGSQSIQDAVARFIRIDGDRLTFDVYKAWIDCTRFAQFDMTRVN
jgi:hypothetical protein